MPSEDVNYAEMGSQMLQVIDSAEDTTIFWNENPELGAWIFMGAGIILFLVFIFFGFFWFLNFIRSRNKR